MPCPIVMCAYYPTRRLKGFRCPKRVNGYPMRRERVEAWIAKLNWNESLSIGLTDALLDAGDWLKSRPFAPWTAYTDVLGEEQQTFLVRYFFSDPADAVEFKLLFS
jgi:hypothetical protein